MFDWYKKYDDRLAKYRIFDGANYKRLQVRADMSDFPWWYFPKYFNFWEDVFAYVWVEIDGEPIKPWCTYIKPKSEEDVLKLINKKFTMKEFYKYISKEDEHVVERWFNHVALKNIGKK